MLLLHIGYQLTLHIMFLFLLLVGLLKLIKELLIIIKKMLFSFSKINKIEIQ